MRQRLRLSIAQIRRRLEAGLRWGPISGLDPSVAPRAPPATRRRDTRVPGEEGQAAQQAWRADAVQAGGEARRPRPRAAVHDLRHTFESHWVLDAGDKFPPVEDPRPLVVTVTQKVYVHLAPEAWEQDYRARRIRAAGARRGVPHHEEPAASETRALAYVPRARASRADILSA